MRTWVIILCFLAALLLSAGFIATAVYSHAWVALAPRSAMQDLIRLFYMPHALSALFALDALGGGMRHSTTAYGLAFVATLPASFAYVLVGLGGLRLLRRSSVFPAA